MSVSRLLAPQRIVVVLVMALIGTLALTPVSAQAVDGLRMSIAPSSGREGLYPVLTSIDPCPAAPGGVGVEIHLSWDQDAEWSSGTLVYGPHTGPLTWQEVARGAVMKNGTINQFRATCGYRDADDVLQTLATYAPVTFTSNADAAHVTLSARTIGLNGTLGVSSSAVPCPTGGQLVSLRALGIGGADPGYINNPPFQSNLNGSFSAQIDFNGLPAGDYWVYSECFEYVQTNPRHAQLEYAAEKITVSTSAARKYVAMGDSFSSGEGNPPFDAVSDINGCHRTVNAWPRYVSNASRSPYKLVPGVNPNVPSGHIACSGAVMNNLFQRFKGEDRQIDRLRAMKLGKGDLVTVTIGGNDIDFAGILRSCFFDPDCGTQVEVGAARRKLNNAGPSGHVARLKATLTAIQGATNGAQVVLVGYPGLIPERDNCFWLSARENAALRQLAVILDAKGRQAASAAKAQYVSLLSVLKGHELCTATSWVFPILSPYNSGPLSKLQGHPLGNGQNAMGRAVLAHLGYP